VRGWWADEGRVRGAQVGGETGLWRRPASAHGVTSPSVPRIRSRRIRSDVIFTLWGGPLRRAGMAGRSPNKKEWARPARSAAAGGRALPQMFAPAAQARRSAKATHTTPSIGRGETRCASLACIAVRGRSERARHAGPAEGDRRRQPRRQRRQSAARSLSRSHPPHRSVGRAHGSGSAAAVARGPSQYMTHLEVTRDSGLTGLVPLEWTAV